MTFGLDLGTSASIVTRIKQNALETVLNDTSNRRTPSLISFSRGSRLFGDMAASTDVANLLNTCKSLKRLAGLTWAEAQGELARLPNRSRAVDLNSAVGFQLDTSAGNGPLETFDATFLLGQLLGGLRRMYEACDPAVTLVNCVVSCPDHFNARQRSALLAACELGGVRAKQLVDESAAVCLSYGIWKNAEFTPATSLTVGFVSMGYSSSSLTVANFSKDAFRVVACVSDAQLGGRDVDALLTERFASEFHKKTGLDCRGDAKAMRKLEAAAERAKMVLTPEGVSKALVSVEFLFQEADFAYTLTLDEFEDIVQPLCARLAGLLEKGLFDAMLPALDTVEIIGGSSRVRAFKRAMASALSAPALLTTLNADEAVSRGACLLAGIIAPTVRVAANVKLSTAPRVVVVEWAGGARIAVQGAATLQGVPAGTRRVVVFTSEGVPVAAFESRSACPPQVGIAHDDSGVLVLTGWPGAVDALALSDAALAAMQRKEAELLKADERALKKAAEENAKEARKSSTSSSSWIKSLLPLGR